MQGHVVSLKLYVAIFTALMVFTLITVYAATVDLTFNVNGHPLNFNPALALAIAGTKATLVILFFMHVKYSGRLTWLVIISGLFFLIILLTVTMTDYASRQYLTYPTH